jgi:hypothetical protein
MHGRSADEMTKTGVRCALDGLFTDSIQVDALRRIAQLRIRSNDRCWLLESASVTAHESPSEMPPTLLIRVTVLQEGARSLLRSRESAQVLPLDVKLVVAMRRLVRITRFETRDFVHHPGSGSGSVGDRAACLLTFDCLIRFIVSQYRWIARLSRRSTGEQLQ